MKKYIFVTAILAVSAMSFATFASDDSERKMAGGAICKNKSPGESDYFNYTYGNIKAITNTSGVTCPLIRDIMDNKLEWVDVSVYDPSTVASVVCWLEARSWYGVSGGSTLMKESGDAVMGDVVISFAPIYSWGLFSQYQYTVECSMPYGAKIYSIGWEEAIPE